MFAKELVGAIGLALPPYVITSTNSGIEYDIVKEALGMSNYTLKPMYVPLKRVKHTLESGKSDLALTLNEASGLKNVFYSDSHITYQNVVITLKKNNLKVDNLADLSKLSISAFQDAKLYLGKDFKKMAENNPNYSEIASQDRQIVLLYKGRVQALVADINIFKYFKQRNKICDTSAPFTIHKIFPETHYKVAFRDKVIRDQFNKNLKKLISSGQKQKIIEKYVK
jgi:polar amino acid transport system substrate-binding protein